MRHSSFGSDPEDAPRRSRAPIWISLALLAAVTGGLYWIVFHGDNPTAAEVPALRASLSDAVTQFNQLEQRVRNWDDKNFDGRLQEMQANVDARIGSVRKQASDSAQSIANHVRGELETRFILMDSRVAAVEKKAEQDNAQIAALQNELASVRGELQQQQNQIEMAQSNSLQDKEYLDSRITDLKSDSQSDLKDFAQTLETRRVDFEISKGHSEKVVEGVSIGIENTNPAFRRVSGWLWVMPDRKTVWLREQGAMEPVVFYSAADGKRREVVFTHVTRTTAVGYLLLPSSSGEQAEAPVAHDAALLARGAR